MTFKTPVARGPHPPLAADRLLVKKRRKRGKYWGKRRRVRRRKSLEQRKVRNGPRMGLKMSQNLYLSMCGNSAFKKKDSDVNIP